MLKKIIAFFTLTAFVFTIGGFTSQKNDFTYRYIVYANSNSPGDLLDLYQSKEYMIAIYEQLVMTLDEDLHQQAVEDNLDRFTYLPSAFANLENGNIKLIIGSGKGQSLSGSLKRNSCDDSATNKKFFILDWLFG